VGYYCCTHIPTLHLLIGEEKNEKSQVFRMFWQLMNAPRKQLVYLSPRKLVVAITKKNENMAGWWYTYPSEKYEFVNWDDDIPNIRKNKIHVPNHQPDFVYLFGCYYIQMLGSS
jgi:hypothetical protein